MKIKLISIIGFLFFLIALSNTASTLKWIDLKDSLSLWYSTLAIGILLGSVLSMMGYWVLSRRNAYSGLALSSSAITGFLAATLIFESLSLNHSFALYGIAISIGLGSYFSLNWILRHSIASDTITAIIYVASTSMSILISNFISQGHHEMENFLFGNSISVLNEDFWVSLIGGMILLMTNVVCFKNFRALVFDKLSLQIQKKPTRTFEFILGASNAIAMILAAKNFGVLTTFALFLFPSLTSWQQYESCRRSFIASAIYGLLIFPSGFLISFFLDWPTGACISLTGFATFIFAVLLRKLMK